MAVSFTGCANSTPPQAIENYNNGVNLNNAGQYDKAVDINQNHANA